MSFRCWGNIVSLICKEWRCEEVDGECDRHTYFFIYRGSGSGGSNGKQKVDEDYGAYK